MSSDYRFVAAIRHEIPEIHSKSSPGMWRPADEVCLCWGNALKKSSSSSRPLWGSSLSKLPNFSLRGARHLLASHAWLSKDGRSRHGGVELSNRNSSSRVARSVMEVLDTGIQRGPQSLACPNPCCDLHNLHILKSCIVYFFDYASLALQPLQL